MNENNPVYCCIPIEFIQPWDQNEAIRQVKELGLGNMVMIQDTFHVGNSDEDRRYWKETFPHLADLIDHTPQFPERPKHGMAVLFKLPADFRAAQMRLCSELGLKVFSFLPSLFNLAEDDFSRIWQDGSQVVLMDSIMNESTSQLTTTLSLDQLRSVDENPAAIYAEKFRRHTTLFDSTENIDFQKMHDWFVERFRAIGRLNRSRGITTLGAIEATSQVRLALEAGADVPVLEMVPHDPIPGLAAVRGAAKAYGKAIWGVHTAMGYYREPADEWLPERLRIAENLFFAGGASIFSECNMPLRKWGSCSGFFSIPSSPLIMAGEEECLEFNDPLCARAREVVSEFYRFTQFHQRLGEGPRVRMGFMLGHLDGWTGGHDNGMWMLDHPGFKVIDSLKTWHHLERVFEYESWYTPPRRYYWAADPMKPLRYGTPPSGQVDLVPAEAPAEVLQGYGTLVFLGWNSMTEDLYKQLVNFVEQGGTLFLSVPHLDTRTRGDAENSFINAGDMRELCGVRILGAGDSIEEVYLAAQSKTKRHVFPQGALYLEEAPLANVELHGARVLAHPRGRADQPVLLEHHVGKGTVYLLATWEYPGERLDAFITDILRVLADAEQGDLAVESRDVFYSVYDGAMPSGMNYSTIYLVNHNIYGQSAYPSLLVKQNKVPIRVAGRDMRIAWVCDGLVISPFDRFVKVTDVQRLENGWVVNLESAPRTGDGDENEERTLQITSLSGTIHRIKIDGEILTPIQSIEGELTITYRLAASNQMIITTE